MPDITMCVSRHCPARSTCWRYRAIPNGKAQGYADMSAECNKENGYAAHIWAGDNRYWYGDSRPVLRMADVDAEYDRENDGH